MTAVSGTKLRDVLDHLKSDHFNGPSKGTAMNNKNQSTLDQPIGPLFERDRDLYRTIDAVCVALGEGRRAWPKVLDAMHKGAGELGGRVSVREALAFGNVWPEADRVNEHLHLLERRDEELFTLEQAAVAALPEQRVDGMGNVLLDQDADHGLLLTDAGEFERRLARGRKLDDGRYGGPQGRDVFRADDRLHIESGIDMLATGERNAGIRTVRARTEQRRIELDQAIAAGHDHASKRRLLDAEVAKARAARVEFSSKPVRGGAATEETLRLLEAPPKLEPPTDRAEIHKFLAAVKERVAKRQLDDDWPLESDDIDTDTWHTFYKAELVKAYDQELADFHGVTLDAVQAGTPKTRPSVTVTDDEVNARMAWLGPRHAKGFDETRRSLLEIKELQAEVDWRLEQRQLDQSYRYEVIHEVVAERRGAPAATQAPQPVIPPGVDPQSYVLDHQVKARIKAEGRKDSDYPVVLDQIMRGG